MKRRNLEVGDVGDAAPDVLGVGEALDLEGVVEDSERDRERLSATRMSSRLTLLELRERRESMRELSSSMCSVNLETTMLSGS